MKNIVIFGAPGSGKGTQSDLLVQKYGFKHISTGDVLRAEIKQGTELGQTAQSYIDKGQLVPDNVLIDIVQERLSQSDCANGFILDGMPRTIPQAEALIAHGIVLDIVLSLEVSDEDIVERMAGRRVCPRCGASYHVLMNPPKQDGVCDACGTALIVRPDDAPETVRDRLHIYHEQTEPLKGFYEKLGLLRSVENVGSIEDVSREIFRSLGIGE